MDERSLGGKEHTGIRSVYFFLMRSASALRFSNECSFLKDDSDIATETDEVIWLGCGGDVDDATEDTGVEAMAGGKRSERWVDG